MIGAGAVWAALLRLAAPAALVAVLWWGATHALDQVRAEARDAGRREIQGLWDQDKAKRAVAAQQATAAALSRAHEQWRNTERIRDEQTRLASVQASALAAARGERDGLRDDLAELSAQRARDRAAGADQRAAERADAAAAVAGQLLDRCNERREGVARAAGDLATQVIGLQDWVRSVVGATSDP